MLTNGSSQSYLQDGATVDSTTISKYRVFCKVTEGSALPKNGNVFTGKVIQENPVSTLKANHIMILTVNAKGEDLGFFCVTGSGAKISLTDIRKAMKNIVSITGVD